MNPFSLQGKTVLITGASSGIGKATAIECARMGANILLSGRNNTRLEECLHLLEGSNHEIICGDLTIENNLKDIISKIPSLDGLVLCAGKNTMLPLSFSSREKFIDIFDTNFFYPVELLRLLVKAKKLNKQSSVVAISSMGGNHFYTNGNGIYGASKAALDSIMKFFAKELSSKKIRVNTVLPAMVDTPLIHSGAVSDEEHARIAETYPLKRYGCPEDIAYAIIYLLSDASSWVTGTSLILDGGKSLV